MVSPTKSAPAMTAIRLPQVAISISTFNKIRMYSSKFSSKDYKVSETLTIDLQLLRLKRQLQDIKVLLKDANDLQYASEMITVSDTLLRLENIQLYKTLLAKQFMQSHT